MSCSQFQSQINEHKKYVSMCCSIWKRSGSAVRKLPGIPARGLCHFILSNCVLPPGQRDVVGPAIPGERRAEGGGGDQIPGTDRASPELCDKGAPGGTEHAAQHPGSSVHSPHRQRTLAACAQCFAFYKKHLLSDTPMLIFHSDCICSESS